MQEKTAQLLENRGLWKAVLELTGGKSINKIKIVEALRIIWEARKGEKKWRKLTAELVGDWAKAYEEEFRSQFRLLCQAEAHNGTRWSRAVLSEAPPQAINRNKNRMIIRIVRVRAIVIVRVSVRVRVRVSVSVSVSVRVRVRVRLRVRVRVGVRVRVRVGVRVRVRVRVSVRVRVRVR